MLEVRFDEVPGLGKLLRDRDFTYKLISKRRYKSRWLLTWQYRCADCGALETCETGMAGSRLQNRRCDAHKNPLMPATKGASDQQRKGINRMRRARGLKPLTPVEALIQMRKASATNRARKGLPKPAPIARKAKAPTALEEASISAGPLPCVFDEEDVDDRDEISGDEQHCLVWCETHREYEWTWIDI